jgi:hypothetical protein
MRRKASLDLMCTNGSTTRHAGGTVMITRSLGRATAALATCAVLIISATGPAGAAVQTGTINSGTLDVDLLPPYGILEQYDMADPVERPCVPGPPFPNPPTMDIDFSNFPTGGTTEVTDIDIGSFFINLGFFGGTYWYEAKFSVAPDPPYDNSGSTSGSAMTQNLTLRMDFYDYGPGVIEDPEAECPESTLACIAIVELDLSGIWIPSIQSAVIDGTGTIDTLTGFCPDPAMEELMDGAIIDADNIYIDF